MVKILKDKIHITEVICFVYHSFKAKTGAQYLASRCTLLLWWMHLLSQYFTSFYKPAGGGTQYNTTKDPTCHQHG